MGFMDFMASDLVAKTDVDNLINEIHLLAYFYHWGNKECWEMPCTERDVFVDKIIAQLRAESRAIKSSTKS